MIPKRMIAISDIHGMYQMFLKLLEKVNYDFKRDQLIILGDLVDRGPESRELIEYLISLRNKGANLVVLRGNHDDMFIQSLNDQYSVDRWLLNGGVQTLESYFKGSLISQGVETAIKHIKDNYKNHIEFLENLQLYYETDDFIFVHAGIDPQLDDWKDTDPHDFMWIRQEFFYAFEPLKIGNKKVVFGHSPVRFIKCSERTDDIWFSPCGQKIGIDGAAAYSGQLNALIIDEKNGLSSCAVSFKEVYEIVAK